MPNRFDQLAVADDHLLLSVFASPPVYPLLRRPMGWMGEAVTLAALRMLIRDSVVGCNDLPCPADQLASCIAAPGERQLLPTRWFVGLNKNTLHDDPTTASAAAARIIREKTAHFRADLAGQRLVGLQDQGGPVTARDDVGHCERLAGTCYAQQRLRLVPRFDPLHQRLDRLRLIACRLKRCFQMKNILHGQAPSFNNILLFF